MNYFCINSEVHSVMVSVISVILHSYITKNVIFVGKNFGHYKKKCNVTGCAVFFSLTLNKKK